jgi:hypothetical protein
VNRRARAACALLVLATLGAAAPAYGPPPSGAMTELARRYLDALHQRRFADAYALLSDHQRAYFGSADAYRSVFAADGFALERAVVIGARGSGFVRVYFVRERVTYVDHATDARRTLDVTVPLGVERDDATWRIYDPGKPYRAYATDSSATAGDLQATVKKLDFYPDRIDVVVTFVNRGTGYVTVLPYGRSVLRDDRGARYPLIVNHDWRVTDKQLFEGIPLAPSARYTGSLAFSAPRLAEPRRGWSLTLAPALRAGADAPFALTVAVTPPR